MISNLLNLLVSVHIGVERRLRGGPEQGATAVEYGLMVAFIAIVIIAGVVVVGTNLSSLFGSAGSQI